MGIYKVELIQKHCVFIQADNAKEAETKVNMMNEEEVKKAETYKSDMVILSVKEENKNDSNI